MGAVLKRQHSEDITSFKSQILLQKVSNNQYDEG